MESQIPETVSQINDSPNSPTSTSAIRNQASIQQENVELKVRVANLESRLTTVLSDASLSDSKIQDLINGFRTIDDLTSQVSRLKSQLEEANNLVNNQKQDISEYQTQADEFRKKIADLSSKLAIEQNKNSSSSDENTHAIQNMKLENSKLKREISALESNNAELSIENMNLKSQLKDGENDRKRYETEINQLKSSNTDLRNKLNVLQTTNNQLQAEIDELRSKASKDDSAKIAQQLELQNKNYISAFKSVYNRTKNFKQQFKSFNTSVDTKFSSVLQSQNNLISQRIEKLKKYTNDIKSLNANTITRLVTLIANAAKLDQESVPKTEYLMTHPEAITEFESHVQTALSINENKIQTEISQLQRQLKKSLNRPSVISPEVANLVQQMQERVQQMTDRVESEHHAFINAIESTI